MSELMSELTSEELVSEQGPWGSMKLSAMMELPDSVRGSHLEHWERLLIY